MFVHRSWSPPGAFVRHTRETGWASIIIPPDMEEIFVVALFVLVLVFIGSELANRTVVALLGAVVVIAFGAVEQSEAAVEFIDWNTIGLLAGMMIIVAVLDKTG